jgi:hypothetical protein
LALKKANADALVAVQRLDLKSGHPAAFSKTFSGF